MECDKIVEYKCSNGHVQKRKCYEIRPPTCQKCEIEDKRDKKLLEMDMELQDKRLRNQVKHDLDVADLELQIRKIREEVEDNKTARERARALEQKKRDLEAAKRQAAEFFQPPKPSQAAPSTNDSNGKGPRQPDSQGQKPNATPKVNIPKLNTPKLNTPKLNTPKLNTPKLTPPKKSDSELEWERQKEIEGASNSAIDDLMGLTGLEEVKKKLLDIKAKIETVERQGIDMKKERMGMVMLGNPGTGMHH